MRFITQLHYVKLGAKAELASVIDSSSKTLKTLVWVGGPPGEVSSFFGVECDIGSISVKARWY